MSTLTDDLRLCTTATRRLYGAAAASCALLEDDGILRYAAADGEGAAEIVGVRMPVGQGIAGWAVTSEQPLAVREVANDPRFARDVAESTRYVPRTILAAPVVADGEVVGVLQVLDPTAEAAADWSLDVLGTLAAQVGLIIRGHVNRSGVDREDAGEDRPNRPPGESRDQAQTLADQVTALLAAGSPQADAAAAAVLRAVAAYVARGRS